MSEHGFPGRDFWIVLNDEVIAGVRSKSTSLSRSIIDRSDEERDGWRHLDPKPESTAVQANVSGAAKPGNFVLLDEWRGSTFSDVYLRFPDGTILDAADGAFLQMLEHTGEYRGLVLFNATFLFSGLVSVVQPLVLTSRPYGLESTDTMTVEGRALRGYYSPVTIESMSIGATALNGTIEDKLISYDAWPVESMSVAGAALDGTIVDKLIVYDDAPLEEMDVSAAALDGTLDEILIRYTIEPEDMDVAAAALDGTLIDPNATYVSVVLADGPVAYYRCGESSGATLVDEIDSPAQDGEINAAVYGEPGAIADDADTALFCTDSDGSYLETPISLGTQTNGGLAIEFWLDWASGRIVFRDDDTSGGTLLFDTSGEVFVRIVDTTFSTGLTTADYRDGVFHHWVIEYDHAAGEMNLYIDGALAFSDATASLSGSTASWFRFFRNADTTGSGANASGTIDEIALYDKPLGLTRVEAHYNQGIGS